MGGRINRGSAGLANGTRSAAAGADVGRMGRANAPNATIDGACETQLHRQAPGGQQSSCDIGGAGATWSVAIAACVIAGMSWHGGCACCSTAVVAAMPAPTAIIVLAYTADVPFATRAMHRSRRRRMVRNRIGELYPNRRRRADEPATFPGVPASSGTFKVAPSSPPRLSRTAAPIPGARMPQAPRGTVSRCQ